MQRHFVTSMAIGAAFGAAFPGWAGPTTVWRIGFLSGGARPPGGAPPAALKQGLHARGYVDGKNLAYIARWAEARSERLPALAVELVGLKPDLIVTMGGPASAAAEQATSSIPIVIANAGDAVATGFIVSLAQPGGNITGITDPDTELSGKRLKLLKEVVLAASRIAVLWSSDDRSMTLRYQETQRAARLLHVRIQPLGVREPDDGMDRAGRCIWKPHVGNIIY